MMKIKGGREPARQGRRMLSILISASVIQSISTLPCTLDYNHTTQSSMGSITWLLAESLFRRSDLYLLRIYRRDSLVTGKLPGQKSTITARRCLRDTFEMSSSSNERSCSRNNHSRGNRERLRIYAVESRKTWRFWSGVCFAIVLLAAFAQPLFDADKLRSQERAVFIHFIDTVCFCLPALPPA